MHALRTILPCGILLATYVLPCNAAEKPWSERFPDVALRVRHLDKRMGSPDVEIRKRVLTDLTFGRPRDSKVYPAFFRALLDDPSFVIRGMAIDGLVDHNLFLHREDLPKSFNVHFLGEFRWREASELTRAREMARSPGASGGWAIRALGIIGDREAIPLARTLLMSDNVFVRFSAALALVQLGEKKEGIDALHQLTDARDNASGFYRYRSAECLFRFGEREAIHELFDQMERKDRESYADGPREILEDLTGQYFLTAEEGRAWWKENGEKKP